MERKNIIIIGVIIVVLVLVILYNQVTQLAGYVDSLPQGQDAINKMSQTELNFLNTKLSKIQKGMNEQNIVGILGEPQQYGTEISGYKIDYWACPQDIENCLIRIKIQDNQVHAIEWLNSKSGFFYEKKFS